MVDDLHERTGARESIGPLRPVDTIEDAGIDNQDLVRTRQRAAVERHRRSEETARCSPFVESRTTTVR